MSNVRRESCHVHCSIALGHANAAAQSTAVAYRVAPVLGVFATAMHRPLTVIALAQCLQPLGNHHSI